MSVRLVAQAVLLSAVLHAGGAAAAPPGGTEAGRSGPAVASTIIDGRVWTCTDVACRAAPSATADSQPATRECARAAQVLGPFTSYASGDRVLSAEQLVRCNARAPAPAGTLARR